MQTQKTADDHMLARPQWASSNGYLHVAPHPQQARIDQLRIQAALLNQQLRHHEAYRMAQTVENFGGPGTARSRYVRAIMTTPYSVNPMLPYMAGGGMGPMGMPPGSGVYNQMPSADLDIRPGVPDPEMTALEQGITRTASVKTASLQMAVMIGREMAKHANEMMYEMSPQYINALRPTQAQEAGKSLAGAASNIGKGLGESAMAAGHGLRALSSSVGRGVSGLSRGVRDFMSQEEPGHTRWGTGMPPAAMTNEYGQPIYG